MDRWKFVNEKWIPCPVSRGESFVSEIAVFSFRCLPHWGRGTASAVDRVLSLIVDLRRSPLLSFIPLSPSNLRPFGAPPSKGRREYPREPLPLEGAAERSEAGLASFFGGEAASSLPSPLGKALCREKRCSRFAAFPTRGRLYFGDSGILVPQPSPLGKGDRASGG